VFASATLEAGDLAPDEMYGFLMPWRRVGQGALRVLAVESDCACAVARGPQGRVEEGAHGILKIRVRGPRRLGAFVQRVRVFTDQQPPRDVVTLRVEVHSRDRAAVLPHLIEVGRRSPGARIDREVEVRLDPDLTPTLTSTLKSTLKSTFPPTIPGERAAAGQAGAGQTLPGERAAAGQAGARGLQVRLVGLDGGVRVLPPVRLDLPGRRVRLHFRAPKKAGDFEGRVLVLLDGELLASARVSGWVDEHP